MDDSQEIRLWDSQWMNVVNHDNCYAEYTKEEAVAKAVKLTEEAMARNFADGKFPPKRVKP
jgi:hypothetical protein